MPKSRSTRVGRATKSTAFLCAADHYTTHDTKGPFHPIQYYYTGAVGDPVAPPQEPDIQFFWLPPEEIRGRFYSVMQNWALEMWLEERMAAPPE